MDNEIDLKKEEEERHKKAIIETINMIKVEGGHFVMGNNSDPVNKCTKVSLDDFEISQTPITQGQFEAVMNFNYSYFDGNDSPVETLTWYFAALFCNELSEIKGYEKCYDIIEETDANNLNLRNFAKITVECDFKKNGFRLPTEAEWEYAARGGKEDMRFIYSGSNDIEQVAWYKNNSLKLTRDVMYKKPNQLGIYEMSGNVKEWCWDWFQPFLVSAHNPAGPKQGRRRVVRGGSWKSLARTCSVYTRDAADPMSTLSDIGFRIARGIV